MKRFTEVLVKLPPESRPALEIALENLKREFKAALEVVGKPPKSEISYLTTDGWTASSTAWTWLPASYPYAPGVTQSWEPVSATTQ